MFVLFVFVLHSGSQNSRIVTALIYGGLLHPADVLGRPPGVPDVPAAEPAPRRTGTDKPKR